MNPDHGPEQYVPTIKPVAHTCNVSLRLFGLERRRTAELKNNFALPAYADRTRMPRLPLRAAALNCASTPVIRKRKLTSFSLTP